MNGAEELNDRFYTGFILMLCGVCVFFALFVLIVIFGKKIKVKWNKVIFFGLLALSVCATALFAVRFSRYCLDFGTVRKGEYRTMTGTVTGYGKAVSFENGSIGFYVPRIRDAETGEIMELHVSGTETGEEYTFLYLPHTELAVIRTE